MQFYSLFPLFQKILVERPGYRSGILQRGREWLMTCLLLGWQPRVIKLWKLSFTISGDSPRIREEICMARDALCHTSLAWYSHCCPFIRSAATVLRNSHRSWYSLISQPPGFTRCNWHTKLWKSDVYNMMIWYALKLQNDNHKVGYHLHHLTPYLLCVCGENIQDLLS